MTDDGKMTDSEKLDEIYTLLTNKYVGLFVRVERLEGTVDGNAETGRIGLTEKMRNQEAETASIKWWAVKVAGGIAIVITALIDLIPDLYRLITGGKHGG